MQDQKDIDRSIAAIEKELARLNAKHAELIARIQDLRREKTLAAQSRNQIPLTFRQVAVTNLSSEEEKIALFRSLFRGREDVYPRRFESVKTGKTGYSPACANEWIPGICHKPRFKCADCKNRAFLPVKDSMMRKHPLGRDPSQSAGGDFIAGVYSLLLDETCWFLAADFDKSTWKEEPLRIWRLVRPIMFPPCLSARVQEMGDISGSSFTNLTQQSQRGDWAPIC